MAKSTKSDEAPAEEAPAATPTDLLTEQQKGGKDPVNKPVEPVKAEVLDIAKDQPYPTADS